MHISKFLAVICVSALGTTSLLAQRPDNDTQARARQQLREAMGELNGQPATNTPAQPVKPVPAPAPAPTQPAVKQPMPVVQPPVAAPAPAVKQPMPATTATPAPMAQQPKRLSPEAEAKARAALHQAEGTQWTASPTAAKPMTGTGTMMTPAPAGKPVFSDAPAMAPAQLAPPPPQLSGTKQQRLDQLLSQYRADQISPQAYHEQRAKILAEQ